MLKTQWYMKRTNRIRLLLSYILYCFQYLSTPLTIFQTKSYIPTSAKKMLDEHNADEI